MGPAQHSTLSSISVLFLQVISHRSRPAMEHMKSRHKTQQPRVQHITQPHLSEAAATALCKHHIQPSPKKAGFDFPTSHKGKIQHEEKEWEEGPWKKHQEPEWQRPEEMHSTDYPGLLSTSNLAEGRLFLPITKLLWVRKRCEEPALWSLIPMQRYQPCFSQRTGRLRMCKERRSQHRNKFRLSTMIYYPHLPLALL